MGSKQQNEQEDLAIQDTLSMTVEERLELLATLIVDKITEDQNASHPLLKHLMGLSNG